MNRAFGRLPAPDTRDRKFAIRSAPLPAVSISRKHWMTGKILDQGQTSQCVAYAGAQWLQSSPIRQTWNGTLHGLYRQCQRNDEWPGEEPLYEGTSVRALFKVLQAAGYVKFYGWAWDVDTIATWILTQGPMVIGVDWHESMLYPDRNEFIHAAGRVVGGHAVLVKGVDLLKRCPDGSRGCVRIANSWGTSFGFTGYCWLSLRDLAELMRPERWGEACSAIEAKP